MKGLVELARGEVMSREKVMARMELPEAVLPGGRVEKHAVAEVMKALASLGCQGIRVKIVTGGGKTSVRGAGYLEVADGGHDHPEG